MVLSKALKAKLLSIPSGVAVKPSFDHLLWWRFVAQLPITWLTNSADLSTRLQSPTKKIVGCKVLQFIHTMKVKKMLGHKTLLCKYIATSTRKRDELGHELRLRSQFSWTEFAQCLCNLCTVWWPLKQSFYMSRIRRKEGPKTYSRILRKSDLNFEILKPRQIKGVEQLLSFKEFAQSACFLGQTWKLQHLILKRDFLKYLNTS